MPAIEADEKLPVWELERVLSMAEVAKFTTLSEDTIERRYAQWIVRLSPRRRGMKLKHVLAIVGGKRPEKPETGDE
jgi:hypothetical protein